MNEESKILPTSKNKNIKENYSFEEAFHIFKQNFNHFSKSSDFHIFFKSINKEHLFIEAVSSLNSDNDKKAFVKFIEKCKPKYIIKKNDNNGGVIYVYPERKIWAPQNINDLINIENTWKNNFKERPSFFMLGTYKFEFTTFEDALFQALEKKRKYISFTIIETTQNKLNA